MELTLRDFLKLLRARWLTVCVSVLVVVLAAVAATLMTTPLYQASTRLFVSTSAAGDSLTDKYQGSLYSQQRVLSYTELITGKTLAQRTIDKLGLGMSAAQLAGMVTATAKPDTVLIDIAVTDGSAVRARDIANALSDEFVGMVKELETPQDGSDPDARVIVEQRATLPTAPVVPQPLRNAALGLALGLLLGIGLALLRDYLDSTVKDADTLQDVTGVGLVGAVPLDKKRQTSPAIAFDRDNTSIAEAFRKLRTNLQFLAVDDPPRVIVITSSLPGEGKSTTAINIALALAETEHRVVLVDGDMRRPSLHKYLRILGTAGFSTVLSGSAALSDVLQKTAYPGLTVLASGVVPPNPSELLGSMAAQKIINELKEQFDYVIIDSSPLLAVTDAAILAAHSDGVLVIARYGTVKRDQLRHAVGNLADVGAKSLGAVFTMTPVRGEASYYYGYHYGESADGPALAASSADGQRRKHGR